MSVLAAVRPDSWNFPLFLHVLGAMVLVGALLTAFAAQVVGWGKDSVGGATLSRLTFRTLLIAAIPAWIVMRIGAEWIYSKENWADVPDEPSWLGVGYITADLGGLLLLVATILAGVGARRQSRTEGGTSALARSAAVLALIALVAYLVAVWAMSAKPD
ncbi:MAG TPA: hypothetical protein VFW80_07680 [Gaiellaceae bacterium]|nr:hypothetical protein [Gaiellaceae bacterium]